MVLVSKEEVEEIRRRVPAAHINLVNRQKKSCRKKYYAEESRAVMNLLKELRGTGDCKGRGKNAG